MSMPLRMVLRVGARGCALLRLGSVIAGLVVSGLPARAQVGPGPVAGPVNVPAGTETVVGSTTITSTGTNAGVNVTGTGTLTFDPSAGPSPGPINVTTANGNGLQAASGGTIFVPIAGVTVQSSGGHAVLANGAGSSVTLGTGTSIGTTGVGSGLVAIGGGLVEATGVTVNNTGASSAAHGAVAEDGGIVNLHAGTSITTGSAFNSVGFGASGAGSQINADALIPLTMNGRGAMGVYMHDGGLVSLLPGSVLQLNGTSSVGVVVDNTTVALGTLGSGLTINLNGVGVAGQAGSTGLYAVNGGNLSIAGVTIEGQNAAAGAWAAAGSTINLSNSTIDIAAEQNQAAYALATAFLVTANGPVSGVFSSAGSSPIAGLFTLGGTINSIDTTINVASNNNAAGIEAGNGGVVNITSNTITTTGTNSFGIRVDGGGTVNGNTSSVTTSGGGAAIAFNSAPGVVSLTDTTVLATGAGTEGMTALNFSVGGTNTFSMSGGSLISQASTGMAVQGPMNISFSNEAFATGGNGFVIAAFNNPGGFQQTNVQVLASTGSTLLGNAFAQSNSILDIDLTTGSQWTGAAVDVTNVTTGATGTWTITDDSTVTDTVTNAGLVEFVPPGGGPFHMLTTQNYVGSGGTLGLNTFLGDDSSPSDLLIIDVGTATGFSLMRITNTVGPGALTIANGILVVDTVNGGSTQPGLFALAGPVVAGPYEYSLYRGSVDPSNPDAWFLRSTLNCDLDPTAPVCDGPDYRPETSLYAALPSMMLQYGRAILDTLHERMGQQGGVGAPAETASNGTWGRIIGVHGNEDGDRAGVFGDGPKYDYDFWAFQAGTDLYRDTTAGARDRAGAFFAIGTARGDVTHFDGTNAGHDTFEGYSIGGYWTHYTPEDAYLDAVLIGTWYNADGQSKRFAALKTDGFGFGASLEGGVPFRFAVGFIVEPQAQLIYQTINLDNARDVGAEVRFEDVNSLFGRLGVRFVQSWAMADAGLAGINDRGRLTAWFRPNIWYEFLGDPKTKLSSADGFIPFRSEIEGATLELNAGITAELSSQTSLYANASYDIDLDGDSDAYNGKLGLKVVW